MFKTVSARHAATTLTLGIARPVASRSRSPLLKLQFQSKLYTDSNSDDVVPLRKQLKEEAKRRRLAQSLAEHDAPVVSNGKVNRGGSESRLEKWRLTVGLEIHAQLNTEHKLFSGAKAGLDDSPNSNVALFDLAFPGSQPRFQQETIIPALRAALGLSCNIHRRSRFDRKHYHYQDQPNGYQITQYYEPFATDGHINIFDFDGIAPEDGQSVKIGIKQVQMEQDTAKSTLQPPSTSLLDFNRVGYPLIEIITLPQIHHPQTAAACARKIQAILQAVNANIIGMEMGGLRVDVNVSVSLIGSDQLGQRTEIKNLSSFKAVEDAIIAERDRQIAVLEAGGVIIGETRGWTLGSSETKMLRGKEGEVDYRYMPDPDIPPLIIGQDLITRISDTLPELPEHTVKDLVENSGLSVKDAKTLVSLDDGDRLEYFDEIRILCREKNLGSVDQLSHIDRTVANWVLHELGGLLTTFNVVFSPTLVPATAMVEILSNLDRGLITGTSAKRLLSTVFNGDERSIDVIIDEENLKLKPLSRGEYLVMAQTVIDENETRVKQIQQKGQIGKLQYLVGQMMRQGEGKVEAVKAERILKELLDLP